MKQFLDDKSYRPGFGAFKRQKAKAKQRDLGCDSWIRTPACCRVMAGTVGQFGRHERRVGPSPLRLARCPQAV